MQAGIKMEGGADARFMASAERRHLRIGRFAVK
ncbi:hypothetical protein GGD55_002956 [Rhizobium giardinii]|uniref:Uncharacterized protein n=1 Tax=Rhizobium giardinii TaxID=56731 RepID=A0A7W8UBC7_9HYPH|nr:hypothetical protein [Rhizobium giardinii]